MSTLPFVENPPVVIVAVTPNNPILTLQICRLMYLFSPPRYGRKTHYQHYLLRRHRYGPGFFATAA